LTDHKKFKPCLQYDDGTTFGVFSPCSIKTFSSTTPKIFYMVNASRFT
jgi:hypothetical protein